LQAQGKPFRALVRTTTDPAKIDSLKALGAELVYGDLKDRASLEAACAGIRTVISTATTTISRQPDDTIESVDQEGQINLVQAAQTARIAQFIYISYSANIDAGDDPSPLTIAKRSVEDCLAGSGMVYTILRPSYYMEIWLSPGLGFDYPNAKAQIYGDGMNKVSFISLSDVAECAIRSIDNPAARNAVIELGGPEALSPLQIVKIFEEVGGQRFETQHVAETDLRAQRAQAADPLQKSFSALMLSVHTGDVVDMTATLRDFPMDLVTVRDYAKRVLT
jgi:NADH dehydrogenase